MLSDRVLKFLLIFVIDVSVMCILMSTNRKDILCNYYSNFRNIWRTSAFVKFSPFRMQLTSERFVWKWINAILSFYVHEVLQLLDRYWVDVVTVSACVDIWSRLYWCYRNICTLWVSIQGSHTSWKVLEFFGKISRTWKVLRNDFGPVISWKFKLEVLEFAATPISYPANWLCNLPDVYIKMT